MPPSRDHTVIHQDSFRGIYSRGEFESVPPGFSLEQLNNKFSPDGIGTRDGTVINYTLPNIVRSFGYKRLGETPRFITLDTSGRLYDSLYSPPIYTDASIVDFSMVNYNNRAYITVHNRVEGIPGKYVLVYEGNATARFAAGTPPTGFTLGAATSSVSGSVEAGIHIIAVSFITSSGFITAPGPAIFKQYTAPGHFKIDISALPIGGSSITARVLLATRAIPASLFTGNQFGYEFFFVPNGLINNNTAMTATIDFFDGDLIDSADYLLDNLSLIPAGVGISVYNSRLIVWGEDGNNFTCRASEQGQPEVFNSVSGFLTIDPSDAGSGLRNAVEYRKSLLLMTSNHIYQTTDNDNDPSTWSINCIDRSTGTECFGIANILDVRGLNNDRIFIASPPGLFSFEGLVKKPELSFNIQGIWNRINNAAFNLVQVVDDPLNHRILISVPLDSSTIISHILYADYSESFTVYGTIDERKFKWDIWTFGAGIIRSIFGDLDSVTKSSIIHIALSNNIYDVKDGLFNDFGNAIESYIVINYRDLIAGWIHHFGGIKLRVIGSGSLQISLYGLDGFINGSFTSVAPFNLGVAPGIEPERLLNFINEKMAIKFRVNLFNEWYSITRVDTWTKELWLRRSA